MEEILHHPIYPPTMAIATHQKNNRYAGKLETLHPQAWDPEPHCGRRKSCTTISYPKWCLHPSCGPTLKTLENSCHIVGHLTPLQQESLPEYVNAWVLMLPRPKLPQTNMEAHPTKAIILSFCKRIISASMFVWETLDVKPFWGG